MHNLTKFLSRFFIVFAFIFGAHIVPAVSATLPSGYTELEYIEGTGTQYIDLGQRIGSGENISARFAYTASSQNGWFGATDGTDWRSQKFTFSYPDADPLKFMVYSTSNNDLQPCYYIAQQPCVVGTIYTVHWYGNPFSAPTLSPEISFNASEISQSNYLYTPTRNAGLFVSNTPSGFPSSSRKMRIYEFQVEGKLKLVPVKRNSDGKIGMYDTVNNRFYTNDGTGEFVAGPAVGIKIATTNYVTREFAPVQTLLTQTNTTITNTITQSNTNTASIATLAAQKQNTPATNCPTGKKCLLVKDINGNDNWYPIIDMVLLSNIIGNATGTNSFNSSTFNSADDTFSRDYGALGTIYGQGRCSSTAGNSNNNIFTNPTRITTLGEQGMYCYCKLNAYKPQGGEVQNINMKWLYTYKYGNTDTCIGPHACDTACGRVFDDQNFSGYAPALLDGIKVAQ